MDRLMATIQASYQREMYKYFGVHIQSQEAFELASQGLLRPMSTSTPPQIYSIKCIEFDRPYFKLEVYCINESNLFLRNLIHDCGIKLKAYAICMQIRRTRDGFVDANDVNNCLVHTEWDSFQRLHDHVIALTEITRERINEYDKQILVGKKRITNEDQSTTPNELNF